MKQDGKFYEPHLGDYLLQLIYQSIIDFLSIMGC